LISEKEAKEILSKYRKSFPTLIKYLEDSGKHASTSLESRTLSQRRRLFKRPEWNDAVEVAKERLKNHGVTDRLPTTREVASAYKGMFGSVEREGKNQPVQGSNADIIKVAMGCGFDESGNSFMWQSLETKYKAHLINMVHDEVVVECPAEYAEECFKFVGDCMMRAGAEFVHSIPMLYDGKISDKWEK
jgi:DNA polymerase I-like protein with 3'-5' exonuclease and polymerase domains